MKAYWWRDGRPNFGDAIAPVILRHVLGAEPEWCDKSPRLLSVGSIIVKAQPGDAVWGSGANPANEPRDWRAQGIEFLAVRGPISRQFVLDRGGRCPAVYGDPALLLPSIHPQPVEPIRELAIMPHLDDDAGWNFGHRRGIYTINPSWPWERVVAEICSSAHVVSSSLHGLIVAEAYGIPATWADFPGTIRPGKFEDYYLGCGHQPPEPLHWPAAIQACPAPHHQLPAADLLPALQAWFAAHSAAA